MPSRTSGTVTRSPEDHYESSTTMTVPEGVTGSLSSSSSPSAAAATLPPHRPVNYQPPAPTTTTGVYPHPSSSSSTGLYSYTYELSHYLTSTFAPSVVPQPDEYLAKESARVYLEQLADRVSPGAKMLPFGSMANGFALKNSDMDLCCCLSKEAAPRPASELVELLGSLIERETTFHVKMLPRARIPIIKLTMPPTPTVPFGMACDIGFENRLALENTRLLLTYAMIDSRLRIVVLFLKVWTKRRKINNPYRGTLSSYGFVLLVIHFLAQVKTPAVLPNLQQLPPLRPTPVEELEFEGNDISFFDDLESLPQVWQCANQDNVGELLIEFFRYYSKDFPYNTNVISIRSETGWLSKESKGWQQDIDYDPEMIVRDQHKLCIEDPFQLDYNVARTVTRDGLYTIRGEFMRAYRLLSARTSPHQVAGVINDVCEEREDYLVPHPPVEYRPAARRRSAPSPRMFPSGHALPHPPPLVPPPSVSATQDFRLWAAMNGVQAPHQLAGGAGIDPRAFVREQQPLIDGGSALDDGWDPTSPSVYPSSAAGLSPSPSMSAQRTSGSATPSAAQTGGQGQSRPPPASPNVPALDRRLSWDGSSGATPTVSSGYDLHRFFQNQPAESSSTTASASASTSTSSAVPTTENGLPPRAAMTAPSSPDLGSQSYYTNGGFMGAAGPSRSYYRYGSHSLGPRMPPRHHYGTASHQHYTGHQHGHGMHTHGAWAGVSPAPIFPEEDREAVAMANTITFGNFPAPSYGGRPSGSGAISSSAAASTTAAAAAGGAPRSNGKAVHPVGGYGHHRHPNPFGVGASGSSGGYGNSRLHRSTFGDKNGLGLREEERGEGDDDVDQVAVDEEDDDEDAVEYSGSRGRRMLNGTIVLPSQDDVGFGVNRQRGRSVPHVRLGPDGRESILFGEITVVLPRPPNEDSSADEDLDSSRHDLPVSQPGGVATVPEALSAPSTQAASSVPLLTTQPPTPLKQAPSFTTFSPIPPTPQPQSPEFLPLFSPATPSTVLPNIAPATATMGTGPLSPRDVNAATPPPLTHPTLPSSPATVPLADFASPPRTPSRSSADLGTPTLTSTSPLAAAVRSPKMVGRGKERGSGSSGGAGGGNAPSPSSPASDGTEFALGTGMSRLRLASPDKQQQ